MINHFKTVNHSEAKVLFAGLSIRELDNICFISIEFRILALNLRTGGDESPWVRRHRNWE